MREPVAREASGQDAIGEAARRLDRALTRLEKQVGANGASGGSDLFEHDRSALAAELDAARARERALEEAAAAASQALGRAAAEVRLALGEDEPDDGAGEEDLDQIDEGEAADGMAADEGAGWEQPAAPDPEASEEAAGAEPKDDAGTAEGGGEAAPGSEPDASDPHKDRAR